MLDELKINTMIDSIRTGTLEDTTNGPSVPVSVTNQDIFELGKLVRLGMWARDMGIPALKRYENCPAPIKQGYEARAVASGMFGLIMAADKALAAIPKEEG